MIITPIDDPQLVAMMGYSADSPRSRDVLHQSDIIKDLMCDLQPKRFKRVPFVNDERVEIGILFESILERALAEKFSTVRPGEIISDEGIAMSPDGVNPELVAGEEYKATFMSCRNGVVDEYGQPLEKFLHWFIQMKGYAKWLDVRRFLLRVLFVNGNYNRSGVLKEQYYTTDGPCSAPENGNGRRAGCFQTPCRCGHPTFRKGDAVPDPESGPTFKTYDILFTDEEIDENWTMLIRHAESKGMLPDLIAAGIVEDTDLERLLPCGN